MDSKADVFRRISALIIGAAAGTAMAAVILVLLVMLIQLIGNIVVKRNTH